MRRPGSARSLALCLASLVVMGAGDAGRGFGVVTRQSSTCVLCHAGPFPNPHLQGDIGPDLHGVGARLLPDEIRARLVDAAAVNPDTVMPSFGVVRDGTRIGTAWRGRPILTQAEIDDAVAYLAGLK